MTAATAARCDYCHAVVPAGETFQPFPGGAYNRCKDTEACERRQTRAFDPTIMPDEDMPVPPPASAPVGTACDYCRTEGPAGGLYERMRGQWFCLDRAACEQRSIGFQYLTAWSDSSPDRLISAADMWAMASSAPPQVPPERTELDPDELTALAWQEALGRKRPRR